MGMLRKVGTYTITVTYSSTTDRDWKELQAKLEQVEGIHFVAVDYVEDVEKHCRGEWNIVKAG